MTNETTTALIDRAANAADQATAQAKAAAQRGVAAMREGSQHLVERAHNATDATAGYIKVEPVKSILMAAAAGAALMALVGLLTRSRDRNY